MALVEAEEVHDRVVAEQTGQNGDQLVAPKELEKAAEQNDSHTDCPNPPEIVPKKVA